MNKQNRLKYDPAMHVFCRGTQGWIAPEMYAQNLSPEKRKGCSVTAKADIYAAGWVFFEVLSGLSPLLFREAKSNDDFAASRVTLACLLCVRDLVGHDQGA